ncbi:MAG TPA: hypothetical protein VM287_12025 [Egibacteraceae bacterium]|nr:hypothetical protein [Egibacteraceae bacterium]
MPPRILITGMLRSGSTRLYNLMREALLVRYPSARAAHYGDVELLERALEDPSPGIFKEHVLSEAVIQRVHSEEVQAVATLRDPVAAMVSLCATFEWSPNVAADVTDRALTSLERIADIAKMYTYETATDYRPAAIRGVLADVGLASTWPEASRLSYRWSRRNGRKHSETLLRTGRRTYDPVTLFHPGHVGPARAVDATTRAALREASERVHMSTRIARLQSRAR